MPVNYVAISLALCFQYGTSPYRNWTYPHWIYSEKNILSLSLIEGHLVAEVQERGSPDISFIPVLLLSALPFIWQLCFQVFLGSTIWISFHITGTLLFFLPSYLTLIYHLPSFSNIVFPIFLYSWAYFLIIYNQLAIEINFWCCFM